MSDLTGTKLDTGKEHMDLIPPEALFGVARVLEFGAKKYSSHNWRGGMAWSRLLAAALRHLFKFLGGQDLDAETGLPHIDHAMCNIMFLSAYFHSKLGKDDRYVASKLETTSPSPVVESVRTNGLPITHKQPLGWHSCKEFLYNANCRCNHCAEHRFSDGY